MRVKIEEYMYGEWIVLTPENHKEISRLKKIWAECDLTKVGRSIHAGGTTQHGIENSKFCIKIISA